MTIAVSPLKFFHPNHLAMTMSTKNTRILACIAAAVSFVAAGPPAQAGNWSSKFDPIGMHGTDLFNISGSDCLPGTTVGGFFYVNNYHGTNNCVVSLLNAAVTLTDQPDTTDTADLTYIDLGSLTSGNIWGVNLAADGTLLGVDSFLIGPQFAPFGSNSVFNRPWWIQFDAGDGQPPPGSEGGPLTPINNTVLLFTGTCPDNCIPDTANGPTYTAKVDGNRFDAVPEPGSLALLAGALGAGWLTRRRKAIAAA